MKFKSFDFDVKSVDEEGVFTGYGSVFGTVDGGGDIVAKGAFADSLAARVEKGRKLPILWQHDSREPIGVYESVKEDDHGLLMTGRLLINDVQRAKEAYALMKAGAVTGMSIGYSVDDDSFDSKTRIRTLLKMGLHETSLVTFPMHDDARVDSVKSKLMAGDKPTIREFEELLREKGFTRSDAEHIAVHGFKKWQGRESEANVIHSEALSALKAFSLH